MASIFRKDDNYVENVPRNTYDMSFQNNLTTDFGSLRPCGIWPVNPGDSWRFKPTYGLRFLPLTFPIQTRMKASIHYFYVRNRNLWKDWPDFIGRTKSGLVPPYIHLTESNRKQIETCQLGDFLGIPTKVYGDIFQDVGEGLTLEDTGVSYGPSYAIGAQLSNGYYQALPTTYLTANESQYNSLAVGKFFNESFTLRQRPTSLPDADTPNWTVVMSVYNIIHGQDTKRMRITLGSWWNNPSFGKVVVFDSFGVCRYVSDEIEFPYGTNSNVGWSLDLPVEVSSDWTLSDEYAPGQALICMIRKNDLNWYQSLEPSYVFGDIVSNSFDVAEKELSELPWRSDANQTGIPLSALPFRAYESIYNSFYRNAENNPLLINGVPEYNRWCRTQEGGADTNFYPIMYHNWEDDFLTTAVPSPQQGNAPLVGLSGTPTLTIGHDDGTTTTAQLDVDDEGNVTAVNAQSGDEATTQALVEAVSYGITINDFRNVNAFQRWLENNIRRGYKYRDQIKTHYGVTVRYDELDMPEFIGGTSQPVIVNQISQTAPTADSVLGDMAGQASAIGSGNEITHYCDEHGFIIAILCVKPVANYSQLLPKFFNVTDAFDYYFPEFGHIGMQPITYKEVTPLQANLEGKLDDVFGYQRAWYDLISKTDEVHGLFRSDFRNFLINRTFDGTPELGKEFTVMDPNQLNEVFAVTENTDKILGQIYMDISKKTAIPLYGIPKLE